MNTKTKQTHPSRILPGTIPDLWEIAHLPELKGYTLGGVSARDLILDTWHLCHKFQDHNEKLLEALVAIFKHIETGMLVRDTSHDSDPDWAQKTMRFAVDIGKASKAIAEATGETL